MFRITIVTCRGNEHTLIFYTCWLGRTADKNGAATTGEMVQSTHSPRPSGAALSRSRSRIDHQNSSPREGRIPGAGSQERMDSDTRPYDKPSGRSKRGENTDDADPLSLVIETSASAHLPQAHAEHALRDCRDNDVDELGIVVDPPASTNTTDKGTDTSDLVFQRFAGPYLLFYAVAMVGVMPRCTVLLASHALPQAPASQAVTGFLDYWQSCTDPANAFSYFSSGGIVYQVLVGSDHVFFGVGMTLACVSILYLTFPHASKSPRGAWRLGTSTAALFLLWAIYFVGVLSTFLADNISLSVLDGLD
jgi:hypothetical protein